MEHGEFSEPQRGEPSEYPRNYGEPALRGTHSGNLFNTSSGSNEFGEPTGDNPSAPGDTGEAQDPNRLDRIRSEIAGLSNRFGPERPNIDEGHLISNDKGLADMCEELAVNRASKPEGMGFIIGSGPLSLLPEFNTEVTVMADNNPEVIEMSKALGDLILESNHPSEVLDRLQAPETRERFPVLARCSEGFGLDANVMNKIAKEADSFTNANRNYHWTNPERFAEVQQALRDRPPVRVVADFSDRRFSEALGDVAHRNKLQVTHANFTNVHDWIEARMAPLVNNLPFGPRAKIVFSTFTSVDNSNPSYRQNIYKSRFAEGAPSYLYQISDYRL